MFIYVHDMSDKWLNEFQLFIAEKQGRVVKIASTAGYSNLYISVKNYDNGLAIQSYALNRDWVVTVAKSKIALDAVISALFM